MYELVTNSQTYLTHKVASFGAAHKYLKDDRPIIVSSPRTRLSAV